MKHILTVFVLAIAMAACKSSKKAETYGQMVKEAPDAKPALYVTTDDQRYVAGGSSQGRQIHYYSREKDETYVIDENTGTVLTTFKSKTPEVQVVETKKFVVMESDEGCGEESGKMDESAKGGDDDMDEGACGKGDDDKDDDACGDDDDDDDDMDACGDDDDGCGDDDD